MSNENMETSTTTASVEEDSDVHERPRSTSKISSSESIAARTSILRRRSSNNGSHDSGDGPSTSSAEKSLPSPVDEAHPEKQNRKVCMLRGAVILTLLSATVTVATLVHLYVTRDEERSFRTQYQDSVSKVAEAFQYGIDTKHDAASTFSAIYTSIYGNKVQEINAQKPVWPNATLPFFAEKAKDLLKISNGRALSFNPIITQNGNRIEWEAHATESAWLLGDKSLVVPPPDLTWPNNRTVSFGIYSRDADRNVVYDPGFAPGSRYEDVLVPVWQIYPIKTNEKAVMFNLHSEKNRQRALDDMLEYKVPTLTAILQLVQDSETRPSSILFFPVFDNFETPEKFEDIGMVNETNVVGSISIVFSWDTLLQMILPNYIKGMICVLKSSTGQEYSYSVSGNVVTFLGGGDLHDPKYDEYEEVVEATLGNTEEEIGQVDYLITYTLVMYPSQTFESEYVTNRAAIYTAGVVLIFLCTSALFLLYDYLVEDRQQKTILFARQSANIVDAMFPAGFRERLYRSQQSNANKNNNNSGSAPSPRRNSVSDEGIIQASSKSSKESRGRSQSPSRRRTSTMGRNIVTLQIDKFMKGIRSAPKDHIPTDCSNEDDKPIADLFLDTSIMFADIVGFTKWSTERSPNEVFRLLERLFWEFDELAAQHNVFKLGTIGDCYIAVTGIPNPILDHASVLTKFSFAARDKVREVCAQLDAEGLDTLKLDMRFGIHSGAITAGILRGTKSRFELFGDTINTASRMESTSVGGKIQVSAETAELIRSDGRERWLVKRDDIVTAKGKGQLQTYWVEKNDSRVSFSEEAADHLPSNFPRKLDSQLSASDRYYQREYDKHKEKEGLFADEKV